MFNNAQLFYIDFTSTIAFDTGLIRHISVCLRFGVNGFCGARKVVGKILTIVLSSSTFHRLSINGYIICWSFLENSAYDFFLEDTRESLEP